MGLFPHLSQVWEGTKGIPRAALRSRDSFYDDPCVSKSVQSVDAEQNSASQVPERTERDPFAVLAGRALAGEEPMALEAELCSSLSRRVSAERVCMASATAGSELFCVRHEVVGGRSNGSGLDRRLGEPKLWASVEPGVHPIQDAGADPRMEGVAPASLLRGRPGLIVLARRSHGTARLLALLLREPADEYVERLALQAADLALELEARAQSDRALRSRAESSLPRAGQIERRSLHRRLAGLVRAADSLAEADDEQGLLERALRAGREQLGVSQLAIWLPGPERGFIRRFPAMAAHGVGGTTVPDPRARPPREGAPPWIDRGALTSHDNEGAAADRVWAPFALRAGGVGYLSADQPTDGSRLGMDDAELLGLFATMVGHELWRLRATEALRESERRFRQLAENVDEAFWLISADQRELLYVSPAFERITGLRKEVLYAEPLSWLSALHPEDRENVEREFEEDGGIGKPRDRECRLLRPDGELRWVWLRSWPVRDEEGRFTARAGVALDVTRIKRVEETLRSQEARLRLFADQVPAALWTTDRELSLTWAAGRALPGPAVESSDTSARPLATLFEGDPVQQEALARHRRALAGESGRFNWTRAERMLEVRVEPLRDADGRVRGCVGVAVDLTERTRVEEELRRSRSLLARAQELAHVGSFEWEPSDGSTNWSDEAFRILGHAPGSFAPSLERLVAALHPDDAPRLRSALREAHDRGLARAVQLRVVRPDGEERMIALEARRRHSAEGGRLVVYGTLHDLTDRLKVEHALVRSEAAIRRLHTVTSAGNAGFSERVRGLLALGIEHLDLEGGLFALLEDENYVVSECRGHFAEAMQPGKSIAAQRVRSWVSQTEMPALMDSAPSGEEECCVAVPVLAGGALRGVIAFRGGPSDHFELSETDRDLLRLAARWVGREIERSEDEHERRGLLAELAHVSRVSTLGELASGLAHELNQPLAAIVNYAEGTAALLEQQDDLDPRIGTAARRTAELGLEAGRIIHRMRELASGKPPRCVDVLLVDVARTAIELLNHEVLAIGARVSLELSAENLCVSGDPTQLQQVTLNLLRNAVEAVEAVEPERREILIRAQPCGPAHVQLTVEDRGLGYPADLEPRLFETFVTTKVDGMGMGLAISRSIAESHGGRLWAERRPEGGAAFHMRLPARNLES